MLYFQKLLCNTPTTLGVFYMLVVFEFVPRYIFCFEITDQFFDMDVFYYGNIVQCFMRLITFLAAAMEFRVIC